MFEVIGSKGNRSKEPWDEFPASRRRQVAPVRNQVILSLQTDFENYSVFKPDPKHKAEANTMLDQVIVWGGAFKTLREK